MTSRAEKIPLSFDKYQEYEISQEYQAYVINLININETEAEDLEYEYLIQGYKIFHSELARSNEGKFNLKIILGKSELIF
ncbi:MAG: hypothetical protein HON90_06880 [Halobacteriovoraceae bacterium]|jgi:hypothetical protein|nr:hypothetical protein [Halobacteriovoraceae bacterium]